MKENVNSLHQLWYLNMNLQKEEQFFNILYFQKIKNNQNNKVD